MHGSLPNRCTGCHGGDPRSADERRAHAEPFVEAPLAACATCHEVEGESFAGGPHGVAFETQSIRGCVECHSWHEVAAPGHDLLRTACERCHGESNPDLVALGREIAKALDSFDATLQGIADRLEAARGRGVPVRTLREGLEGPRLAYLELLPKQHAMDLDPFRVALEEIAGDARSLARDLDRAEAEVRGRRRWIPLVWGIAGFNVVVLALQRRRLRRRRLSSV